MWAIKVKKEFKMDENNLNEIQLGELSPNEFDYDLPISELDKQLTEKYERLKAKKITSVSGECAMLGCALDLIEFADNNLDIQLDFSTDSLEKLRDVVVMMKESYAEEKPSDDVFTTWVNMTSGLLGCIIIKNLGGNWVESNAGMSVVVNGTVAFITNQLLGVISGANDNENFVNDIYSLLSGQKNAE